MNKSVKEDAPVNNVGSGNIAGTQGDAGKKVVMNKKMLKRFKEFSEAFDHAKAKEQNGTNPATEPEMGIYKKDFFLSQNRKKRKTAMTSGDLLPA